MADTIAAIATGEELSAIGIIRISGDDSISLMDRVFFPVGGKKMSECADRLLAYGELRDEAGEVLDICLCTISRAPNSYTGENTAELQLHGSPTVLSETLALLFRNGARQALAGEFTKRAFLNGRMDLTQAEAVVDLIHSETAEAAKIAAGQLGGAIFKKVDAAYSKLADIMSHFHAVLDYPDEDIEDFEIENYAGELDDIAGELKKLLESFARGRLVKEGVAAAIVGKPNVGKSSVLNTLLGYERAIVTSIPGTTRDTIEGRLRLGGVLLRLVDTAGIRETDDVVENIGVKRSISAIDEAELILAVFDVSEPLSDEDLQVIDAVSSKENSIALINKTDLTERLAVDKIENSFSRVCRVSANLETGFEELGALVAELFPKPKLANGEILTNARQADNVRRACEALDSAAAALRTGLTPDAVLTEVEESMSALGELTGKTVREDITSRIFERFCVGK